MRRTRTTGALLGAFLLLAGTAVAQTPQGPPAPGPEHKKLGWFVGTWSGKGEMKPGPMGPGGAMAWSETCEWFDGGFAVVCRSEGKGPQGAMKGISILTYNPEKKVFTFYGTDNMGWSGLSEGTTDGKVWTYTSTETMGGKPMQGRFTLTQTGPNRMTFAWEMSEDGKTWLRMMDGESTK